MDSLLYDLRYAMRALKRSPGFTVAVVACLSLGVGANALMFGVIDRLFLRAPPHVEAPGRVARLYSKARWQGSEYIRNYFTHPEFDRIKDRASVFSMVAAFAPEVTTIGRGADAFSANVVIASHTFFQLLGVRPAIGRLLMAGDDTVTAAPAAVLDFGFWTRQFGGDSSVLGRPLTVANRSYTIVGVAPRGFTGVDLHAVDVWLPVEVAGPDLTIGFQTSPINATIEIVGRLKPGASFEEGEVQATAVLHQGPQAYSATETRALLGPIQAARGPERDPQLAMAKWLAVVSGVVLLIACFNVTNLLLARTVRRRREIAIRLAIGVNRRRLVRQLLAEGMVLSSFGAIAAVGITVIGSGPLQRLALPDAAPGSVWDARTFIFSLLAALIAGVLAGLAPALRASRADLTAALASGTPQGGRRFPLSTRLLVAQVALSLVLVVGAGLFIESLRRVEGIDLGFQPDHLLTLRLDLKGRALKGPANDALYEQALDAVRRTPGVTAASASSGGILGSAWGAFVRKTEGARPGPTEQSQLQYLVSSDFFRTTGVRIMRGRGFDDSDRHGSPEVAVVGETLAKTVWPGENPVGKCFYTGDDRNCIQVVGEAQDVPSFLITRPPSALFYLAFGQADWSNPLNELWIRTSGDAHALITTVRREVQSVIPDAPFVDITPVQALIAPQLRPWLLDGTMFGAYGALALILTGLGLYGVLAYGVNERTREIGIRRALGADGAAVIRMVVRDAIVLTIVGVALGAIGALLGGKLIGSLLYGVRPGDPMVLGSAVSVLVIAALAASWLPARRAEKIDPMVALRYE